ncbi:scarecrow-like protein 27 [Ananas comosus]|uniref:Scarecrow-like protein 27 n=1 Tax=Ananas comosus TaxID=4615 RepID=A0A6P5FC08_ANACO|nr:scarecrow-like protein 27 [Ananas comosus]
MKGMPFNAQIKGALEEVVERRRLFAGKGVGGEEEAIFWVSKACGGGGHKEGSEPRSVLDRRRSPSPPTSSSTFSSSLGGGGGGGGASDVAAVPDNNPAAAHQWPLSSPVGGGGASDLPPMTATAEAAGVGHEMGFVGGGGERCGLGGGDEWEAMLSGSAAASAAAAVPEQSFLRWIMGDAVEGGAGNAAPGFGFVDHPSSFGLELIGAAFGSASAVSHSAPPHPHPPHPLASNVSSSGGFSPTSSNNSINKIPSFGNQIAESLLSPLPAALLHNPMEEKPQLFGPSGLLLNPLQQQQQPHAPPSPGFFVPVASSYAAAHVEHQLLLPPRPKRHHAIPGEPTCQIPFGGASSELFLRPSQLPPQPQNSGFPRPQPVRHDAQPRPTKPKAAAGHEAAAASVGVGVGLHPPPPPPLPQQQQQQAVADQLIEAAKMVEAGNAVGARGILARLNQHLPAPVGKPLLRSAFYFKEALGLVLSNSPDPLPNSPSPLDVVFKLSAYKAFSEVSPVLHFANFTRVQALLEELGAADRISVIDFDIGVGGHWSSFMQELAQRRRCTAAGSAPALKITAFISPPSSHHPLELHLVRENLSRFAADLDIPFEFSFLTLESFHPSDLLSVGDEAIAVNLPLSSSHDPSFPTLLRLVKQLAPKIVVSVDHGFDRCDLPFASHFLCALQSHVSLLDSIDASGASFDVADKIERFLLQPRIESALLGAHRVAEKMPHWKTLFSSAGFAPVQFSNFTETQAECLLKRVQVRGFHVEKRQASLFLYWQRRELVSVSAWRC